MALATRPGQLTPSLARPVRRRRWRQALLVGVGAALLGSSTGPMTPARSAPLPSQALAAAGSPQPSPSSPNQLALVELLVRRGVLFYGAWWCGHCNHQKGLFGAEAASKLPYVECDKDDPGRRRCQTAKIRAFPTWDYRGERREGVLELEELRIWVGGPKGASRPAAKSSQT